MTFCSHTTTSSPYVYSLNGPHDYREITISLVNGVDISLIDPELYENLLPFIDRYILKFQDRNDTSSVDTLKFCKEYIYQYPERERIAKLLTKKRKDPPQKQPPFTQDQLDSEIEKLLNLKKIDSSSIKYTPDEIEQILAEMRTKRAEAADEENFELADRLALVSTKLSNQGAINQIRKIKIDQAEEMKQKLTETKQTYNELKERWNNLEINFKEETSKELDQMKEKQRKELIEFEKKKDGPIPPKYRKHTSEYLNLKQEEKMLVSSKRFDEAAEVQQRVREQEELEEQMINQEWQNIIERDLKKLTEKHKQQINVREMNIKKEKKNIEKAKKKELSALKSKIAFLENQIQDLESYGSPNQEKKSNTNDAKNEGLDQDYYSCYESCDTEEGRMKSSIISNENSNELFFTENKKAKANQQSDNSQIENKEEQDTSNENADNISQNTEATSCSIKFAVHPPPNNQDQDNFSQEDASSIDQKENINDNQEETKPKRSPRYKSSAYSNNSTTLPRLKMVNKTRPVNANHQNGPEAFRQRALLNKQLYCGKTLLAQHAKNQKDDQRKKKLEKMNSELI